MGPAGNQTHQCWALPPAGPISDEFCCQQDLALLGPATQQGPNALGPAARLKTLKDSLYFFFIHLTKKIVIDSLWSVGQYASIDYRMVETISRMQKVSND